jgi:membrane protein required for colicin V production
LHISVCGLNVSLYLRMGNFLDSWLDIVIGIVLLWSIVHGFRKGLVIKLASLLALILGIVGALKFADITATYLNRHLDMPENYTPLLSFAATFILIVIGVHFLAKLVSRLVKMVALGFINRLAGAAFSLLQNALILCFVLFFIESVDQKLEIIPTKVKNNSQLYYPMAGVAFYLVPKITSSVYFDKLLEEYQELKNQLEASLD